MGHLWASRLLSIASTALQASSTTRNPFEDQTFYLNPINAESYDASIARAHGDVKASLERMQKVPTAYWIDRKAKLEGRGKGTLRWILEDASAKPSPELVVLIWYDLPNRDCHADASAGEICCHRNHDGSCDFHEEGGCEEGIREYKAEFVDPFVSALREYAPALPVVVVLEPDSLPNLATNSKKPRCGNPATRAAYREGLRYAAGQLTSEAPDVSVYIDAAHGGWLGWEKNIEKFVGLMRDMDLPVQGLRGFSTNVANYQPLGVQCPFCPDDGGGYRNGYCLLHRHLRSPCCEDACGLLHKYNPANNELNYAADLVAAANALLGMDAHVIIDTGRNGVPDMRKSCDSWCNPRGAGAGVPSTAKTANRSLVDAYFWLKTPGESDGCSAELPNGDQCERFDEMCESEDSLGSHPKEPRAPQAGAWFDYQVRQLAENARFEPPEALPSSMLRCAPGGDEDEEGEKEVEEVQEEREDGGSKGARHHVPELDGSGNPFKGRAFYVNPANSREYDRSIATASGETKVNLKKMQKTPSAYWIDVKAKIRGKGTRSLEGILEDAASKPVAELVVFVWYDLPNRDCHAKASNGEICCYENGDGTCDYQKTGDCAEGIERYKTEYVDPFVSVLKRYEGEVPSVVVLEPDSLPNLAVKSGSACENRATITAYEKGIQYAVEQLSSEVPSVAIYLDAAHGGWLGWDDNIRKLMGILDGMALPVSKVRGFSTNVANYQPLGVACPFCPDLGNRNGFCQNGKNTDEPCCADACKLLSQYNPGNNELNYATELVVSAKSILGMDAHVIIDTGRNGRAHMRDSCSSWCNPRGAGAGVPSTADTANTSAVDAYFWLKTPGESDGCTETLPDGSKCVRFDRMCGGDDAIGSKSGEPRAPEAGQWFDYQVKQLAANARFEQKEAKHAAATCMSGEPSTSKQAPPGPIDGCSVAYQQCGGQTWTGPTCCTPSCACQATNEFYSQCVPPSGQGSCGVEGAGGGGEDSTSSWGTIFWALPFTIFGGAAVAGSVWFLRVRPRALGSDEGSSLLSMLGRSPGPRGAAVPP